MRGDAANGVDADLAARALAGEKAAFTTLMRRHQEMLYRFIRRYVGDADEAYDLVQEAFVSAWEGLNRFDRNRPVEPWLRQIALNKCRDWSRRRSVRRFFYGARSIDTPGLHVPAPSDDDVKQDVDREALLRRLDDAIAALPLALKEPLFLTVFGGCTHQEAAEALGITSKAVETRVHRARTKLGEALAN
ncbi:MAG: RNA polymerase sigma factor [Alphaproteobacteria bacterium]|nr:RNA polymerase sigma factor [Alphaproteobacteria bacterium]